MEHIIQQIALQLAKNITEKSLEGGLSDLDALASDVLADCKSAAREIVEVIVAEMNTQIREDKSFRKDNGLILKEKDRPRTLLTELGEITFKRDYFKLRNSNIYEYILDEVWGYEEFPPCFQLAARWAFAFLFHIGVLFFLC
mgnify:CR=1 FL=1